ncbi:MAG: prepilin peptidase, partial [Hyphomicrobiales bacterium]|nr:prepilin peptidase [Hyphomicrobiales bacterium]
MTVESPENGRAQPAPASAADVLLIGIAGLCAASVSYIAAPGWIGLAGAALAAIALAIAVVDRRKLIIPNELNGLAFVAGLGAAALKSPAAPEAAALGALLRASVMFAAFFTFRAGYRQLRGVEGMGLGDVKLAAVAGVWLDWTDLPIAVEIAALSALSAALVGRLRGGDH